MDSMFIDASVLILGDYAADIRWHRFNQLIPHDPDFYIFSNFTSNEEIFLDVGANIGISVISFRLFNQNAKVISIEPSLWLEPALAYLKSEEGERFDYFVVGVGDKRENLDFYVPSLDNRPNFYLASFDASRFSNETSMKSLMGGHDLQVYRVSKIPMKIIPIDDLEIAPTLVKLDVEEYELQALQGMQKTISNSRPLIMLEGANRKAEIRAFFRDRDYVYAERAGKNLYVTDEISDWDNGFFLAKERLAEYEKRGVVINPAVDDLRGIAKSIGYSGNFASINRMWREHEKQLLELAKRDAALAERDQAIAKRDAELSRVNTALDDLRQHTSQLEEQLLMFQKSRSVRITVPLSALADFVHRLRARIRSKPE